MIDESFATSTFAVMSLLIGELNPYLVLSVGVLLALVALSVVIGLLHHK